MAETVYFSAGGALFVCFSLLLLGADSVCSEQDKFCPDATLDDNVRVESMSLLQHALQVDKVSVDTMAEHMKPTAQIKSNSQASSIQRIQKKLAKVKALGDVLEESVPVSTAGCSCNNLRMLWHDYAMSNHLLCLHGINCTYTNVSQSDWHMMAAAANSHYRSTCNSKVDESCRADEAQAVFYRKKQELVANPSSTLKAEIDHVLFGTGGSGCSCDPASIAMHRVWKAGGYFPDASDAYLQFCKDTPNTECSCDPNEAAFHFLAQKAHDLSERDTGDVPDEAAAKLGHQAYVTHCPDAVLPNESLIEELLSGLDAMESTSMISASG